MAVTEQGNLSETLHEILAGSVGFIGVGNVDRCDDGAGVVIARLLKEGLLPDIFEGALTPERILPAVQSGAYDTVVFFDAVDAGAQPGSVVLMNARDIATSYPQVSTHKISLGTLAGVLQNTSGPEVYLLGIQPETVALQPGAGLSETVDQTVKSIVARIMEIMLSPHTPKRRQVHAL
jgi:hydrogenase maturation protease